jgi:hypothetical protein
VKLLRGHSGLLAKEAGEVGWVSEGEIVRNATYRDADKMVANAKALSEGKPVDSKRHAPSRCREGG